MTHTPTLKPCPFCGDPMKIGAALIEHVEQGKCPIGAQAYPVECLDRWNTRAEAIEAGAVKGVIAAAEKLSNAERGYRLCHDVKGDGHIETGRAWDYMRRCGDALRAALSQLAEASNGV